jgi:putative thiamine transport system permease protein
VLRLAPILTLALFLAPIAAGLVGTLLPAFGYFPPIGGFGWSLEPWRELFATPGIGTSLRLTVTTGFAASLISLILAVGFCALAQERPALRRLERLLAPLLATPHVAVAIGLAFLIAPSGFLVRLLSPEITGWERPPTWSAPRDPLGLSLVAGLVLKETPFLVLMLIGAATQVPVRAVVATGRAMGYSAASAWLKGVLPQLYPQIRLPVFAVLAFSLSVVEVPLVLAPGQPPPLSVLAARWFADYDLRLYFVAAAAATLQLAIVAAALAFWRIAEIALAPAVRAWIEAGARGGPAALAARTTGWISLAVGLAGLLTITVMSAWSFALDWRYPDALPARWTLDTWRGAASQVGSPLATTVVAGLGSALIALLLAVACLENEQRRGLRPGAWALRVLYVPLLVPPIAFLFGVQVVLVRLGLDATLAAVIWAHLLFVLPYVFLSLADPYRAFDTRYARIAAGLGTAPWRTLVTVKLPMLLRPVLIALAIGFGVSVAQYLPTLFAGAGRVATLTTEAVTLSAGADRRLVGVYTVLQSALPLVVYGLCLGVPALVYRQRKALR